MRKWLIGLVAALSVAACAPKRYDTLAERLVAKGSVVGISFDEVALQLDWLWAGTGTDEWLACLQGEMRGDTLYIVGIEVAKMGDWAEDWVDGDCRHTPAFVSRIHPHSYTQYTDSAAYRLSGEKAGLPDICYPSDMDWETYFANVDAFNIILCDQGVLWISRDRVRFMEVVNAVRSESGRGRHTGAIDGIRIGGIGEVRP